VKALSIRQPWTYAIQHLGKRVENRTWPTPYRGKLLLHAGKKKLLESDASWMPAWLLPSFEAAERRDEELSDREVRASVLSRLAHDVGAIVEGIEDVRKFVRGLEEPLDLILEKNPPSLLAFLEKHHQAEYHRLAPALATIVEALPAFEGAAATLNEFHLEYDDDHVGWEETKDEYCEGAEDPGGRTIAKLHIGADAEHPDWYVGCEKNPDQYAVHRFGEGIWVELKPKKRRAGA
jgi:hypothetical protein